MSEPSPTIRKLLDELSLIERHIARRLSEDADNEALIIAFERRQDILTAALAIEPCHGLADVDGKLETLCQRLLASLHPRDPVEVLTFMLAQAVRRGLQAVEGSNTP